MKAFVFTLCVYACMCVCRPKYVVEYMGSHFQLVSGSHEYCNGVCGKFCMRFCLSTLQIAGSAQLNLENFQQYLQNSVFLHLRIFYSG